MGIYLSKWTVFKVFNLHYFYKKLTPLVFHIQLIIKLMNLNQKFFKKNVQRKNLVSSTIGMNLNLITVFLESSGHQNNKIEQISRLYIL